MTFKHADLGTVEGELDTTGKTIYSLESDKLTKGLVVKISGTETPSGALNADYRQEHFAVSADVDVAKKAVSFFCFVLFCCFVCYCL